MAQLVFSVATRADLTLDIQTVSPKTAELGPVTTKKSHCDPNSTPFPALDRLPELCVRKEGGLKHI